MVNGFIAVILFAVIPVTLAAAGVSESYQILGATEQMSMARIERLYAAQFMRYHPQLHAPDSDLARVAAKKLKPYTEAIEELRRSHVDLAVPASSLSGANESAFADRMTIANHLKSRPMQALMEFFYKSPYRVRMLKQDSHFSLAEKGYLRFEEIEAADELGLRLMRYLFEHAWGHEEAEIFNGKECKDVLFSGFENNQMPIRWVTASFLCHASAIDERLKVSATDAKVEDQKRRLESHLRRMMSGLSEYTPRTQPWAEDRLHLYAQLLAADLNLESVLTETLKEIIFLDVEALLTMKYYSLNQTQSVMLETLSIRTVPKRRRFENLCDWSLISPVNSEPLPNGDTLWFYR